MNFRIIEGETSSDKALYNEIKDIYVNLGIMDLNELSEKYDASINKVRRVRDEVCEEMGITPISRILRNAFGSYLNTIKRNGTYLIGKKNNKYGIQKSIDGEVYWFGRYTTKEQAIKARDMFIANDWDKSKIKEVKEAVL